MAVEHHEPAKGGTRRHPAALSIVPATVEYDRAGRPERGLIVGRLEDGPRRA